MAIDKAIDSAQLESDLTGIADAIRAKDGTSASLSFPAGFVSAIDAITSGGVDRLKSVTVTLTQDYAQSGTVGTTLKNLFDTAIGTDYWVACVSAFPSGITDLAAVVIRAFKFTSLSVANMQGNDTDVMSSSAISPSNAAFFRSYDTNYCQGSYPGATNAKAYAGMEFTVWGWNAS